MKRSYALAAAAGATAVIGLAGTALAAADDSVPTPSASPSAEVLRGDGSPDDSGPSTAPTAEPGSVTPTPSRSASTGLGSAAGSAATSFSAEQARARALATVGGGRVTKVEAETEHGRAVWEIEIHFNGVEHDLDIDRRTGAVTDRDRTDDRGREGNDDRHGDDSGHGGDDRRGDDNSGHGRGGDDD